MLKVFSLTILICLLSVGAKAQNQCSGYLKAKVNPRSRITPNTTITISSEQIISIIKVLIEKKIAKISVVNNLSREDFSKIHGIKEVIISGKAFTNKVKDTFGSWDVALKASGADPLNLKTRTQALSKEQLIEIIQALDKKKKANVDSVVQMNKEELSQIYPSTEFSITGKALYQKARKVFGSWNEALMASGLKLNEVRKTTVTLSQEQMLEIIKSLAENGELNFKYVLSLSRETLSEIHKNQDITISGDALINRVQRSFGSWDKALELAGFNPAQIRKFSVTLSHDQVIQVIKKLAENDMANYMAVAQIKKSELSHIISSNEFGISGSGLIRRAIALYGSWDKALVAANLNPKYIRKLQPLSNDEITNTLLILSQKMNVNYEAVRNLTKDELDGYRQSKEFKISGAAFMFQATQTFGSWDKALIAAQLNPDKIRLKGEASYKILTEAMKYQRRIVLAEKEAFAPDRAFERDATTGESSLIAIDKHNPETIALKRELDNQIEGALSHLSNREQQIFTTLIKSLEEMQQREDYYRFDLSELIVETTRASDVREREVQDLFMKMSANQELKELLLEVME